MDVGRVVRLGTMVDVARSGGAGHRSPSLPQRLELFAEEMQEGRRGSWGFTPASRIIIATSGGAHHESMGAKCEKVAMIGIAMNRRARRCRPQERFLTVSGRASAAWIA